MKKRINIDKTIEILKQRRQTEIIKLMHPWLIKMENINMDKVIDRLLDRPREFHQAFKLLIDANLLTTITLEQVLNAHSPRLKASTYIYSKMEGFVKYNFLNSSVPNATADAKTSSQECIQKLEALPLR